MTHAPFRPQQSGNRSSAQSGAAPVVTSHGNGGAGGVTQKSLVEPTNLGKAGASKENIHTFITKPRRKVAGLSTRARIRTKLWSQGASSALEAMINKAVEAKLAERLPPAGKAVVAARERGAAWKRSEIADTNNLSLQQASAHIGLSTRVINERRNDGRYYALLAEGQTRGFRFPRWQFDVPQQRLQAVLDIAQAAGATTWGIHVFMISPSSLLDGATPRDWIGDAAKDLARVTSLARNRFHGDQGAG